MSKNMSRKETLEVFDGVMLGDGGLVRNGHYAQFQIALSGIQTVGYLSYIRDTLLGIGILPCREHPKVTSRTSKGKHYDHCHLASRTSPMLMCEYTRWYPEGRKVVPSDVRVTPLSLAHWFMGDGCSGYYKDYPRVCVDMATCSFDEASIIILEDALRKLGMSTGRSIRRRVVRGSGISIRIRHDSTDRFMDIVAPHMLEPYMYKVKYRGAWEHE